jgi:hypothetical protein
MGTPGCSGAALLVALRSAQPLGLTLFGVQNKEVSITLR